MALANLHICIDSTELTLCHTVISTKFKCAGLFDLYLTLNQAKAWHAGHAFETYRWYL